MRELRKDPTTGDVAVIAAERTSRPRHLAPGRELDRDPSRCPFCPGHEHATPPTIQEVVRDGRWVTRAFPNKFPALAVEGVVEFRGHGPYDRVSGVGAHEVIVESPRHDVPAWRLGRDAMTDALRLARERMRDLRRDVRLRQFVWFRNVGPEAGASLGHPHAQLIATPVVPPLHRRMIKRMRRHFRDKQRDLLGDLLAFDVEEGKRVVADAGAVVAVCPYAPRAPFEVWLVPRAPLPSFPDADDAAIGALADAMVQVLRAYDAVLEDPPYNAILYTAPNDGDATIGFRWHVRLLPRTGTLAGFELGSGAYLHGVLPEEAARLLRGR